MNVGLQKLGLIKLAHIADFEDSILRHFTPYWDDFKPYVRRLRSAFWPTSFQAPNDMTSGKMLEILREAIDDEKFAEVQPESGGLNTSVSQSYAVLNSKRNRQGQDVAAVSKRMKIAPGPSVASKSPVTVMDFGIWKESVIVPDSDAVLSTPPPQSFHARI